MNSIGAIAIRLDAITRQGIEVSVSPSGPLQVRPASRLSAGDREWLRDHARVILTYLGTVAGTAAALLSGQEPWNVRVALQLMNDADAMVERSGVDGRHPVVKESAAMVASAFVTRDMETLRFAFGEFTTLVRRLAGGQLSVRGCRDSVHSHLPTRRAGPATC